MSVQLRWSPQIVAPIGNLTVVFDAKTVSATTVPPSIPLGNAGIVRSI